MVLIITKGSKSLKQGLKIECLNFSQLQFYFQVSFITLITLN